MHILIVGAGVAGLSAAHALAARGVRATVLAPDHGATARGAGIVSAQFRDPELRALALRSQEIVRGLVPVNACGHAQIATSLRGAQSLDGLAGTREGLPAHLADALMPSFRRRVVRAVFRDGDFCIATTDLLRALGDGVRIVRCRARAVRDGVVLTDRGALGADRILVAAGESAARLVPGLKVTRERAHLARLRVCIPAMLHVVETGFYARPDRDGVLAGNGSLPGIRHEARRVLGAAACVGAGGADVVFARDGRPILRRVSETIHVLTALGGDGLALAPALGERAAKLLLAR